MNKEDLMIGDWASFNGTTDRVQEILYVEGYCASFAASATLFPVPLDKIIPIRSHLRYWRRMDILMTKQMMHGN